MLSIALDVKLTISFKCSIFFVLNVEILTIELAFEEHTRTSPKKLAPNSASPKFRNLILETRCKACIAGNHTRGL